MYTKGVMTKVSGIFLFVTAILVASFVILSLPDISASKENLLFSPLADNQKPPVKLKPVLKDQINILLLGLDGRRGDKNPRCDAIHMLSFDNLNNKITITSVPRGTEIRLSKNENETAYLSNYCHYFGLEAAFGQIEKITSVHPDYTVRVGFSQVLGILRNLNLPTTPTLQFLRNRNISLGDYQRSHNQAVFIKDMLIANIDKAADLPEVIKYLTYKMLDTDMPFEIADELLAKIKDSQIGKNPDAIVLTVKPTIFFKTKDVHLPQSGDKWMNDREYIEFQKNLKIYLNNLLDRISSLIKNSRNKEAFTLLETPFSQKIWLQVEENELRDEYHFDFLRYFLLTSPDNENLTAYISDFVSEMEINGNNELKSKAEILYNTVN